MVGGDLAVLTMKAAQEILAGALAHAGEKQFKRPVAISVLDVRGMPKAFIAQDGTSLRRADIAHGKAYAAIALGYGTRWLVKMTRERPHFVNAVSQTLSGALIPVQGGVLIRDENDEIIGAVGVSGDSSDNDEAAAVAGIAAAGLHADTGEE